MPVGKETLIVVTCDEEMADINDPEDQHRGCRFRPIGFILGLPFALCAGLLSLSASIVWILGSLLTYVCPRLGCCAQLANKAMDLIRLPIDILRWSVDLIPC